MSATLGTSGVVFAATDRPFLDPGGRLHTFCHAIPDRWHVMGVTQAAGLSLRWLRDQFGLTTAGDRGYEEMVTEASSVPPGAEGVLWAPYLMGERTPHLDPNVRAALVGIAASHSRAHVVRAVLEGVAFSLRDSFTIFPSCASRSGRFGSAAAARGRRPGARSRPTFTARMSKPSRRKKAPATGLRFWRASAQDSGTRSTRRAMPSSEQPRSHLRVPKWFGS